ncbi:hypothetical protein NJ7G_0196 [Natrinema sp. J7-2]|nr:hypothetical protein NJ7G_0196 [Natrinema sp. J7-2]
MVAALGPVPQTVFDCKEPGGTESPAGRRGTRPSLLGVERRERPTGGEPNAQSASMQTEL